MDYLTKYPECFATEDQTAGTVAKLLVKEIICRHGAPSQILTDRGANFMSELMKEVMRIFGIHIPFHLIFYPSPSIENPALNFNNNFAYSIFPSSSIYNSFPQIPVTL